MSTLQRSIVFIVLLSALVAMVILYRGGHNDTATTDINATYSLLTTDEKSIHITGTKDGFVFEEYKGKILFLEMFGYKCPPCLKMIDRYKKLKEKYGDKIAIVAIETQGLDHAQLKSFVAKKGINYTTISIEKAYSFVSYIQTRTEWMGQIPFLMILDKYGKPQFTHTGLLSDKFLDDVAKELQQK